MTETLKHEYSSESAQLLLSNEYPHNRVTLVFMILCILKLWVKIASALEGLTFPMLRLLCPKHNDAKIFENHSSTVMLVFIRNLLLSTLR